MTRMVFCDDVRAFLAEVFLEGSPLPWSQIAEGRLPQRAQVALDPWLERLSRDPGAISMLPRPDAQGTAWYGLAHSFAQAERLREELLAFLGPTYSDFTGLGTRLDPADPVEAAVMRFTAGYALGFRVPREAQEEARHSLERLRGLWAALPTRTAGIPRQTGRILRDYQLALVVSDLDEAARRLDELRENGRLDARNLLFLEVQRLASGERWSEMLALPHVPDLAQIRCPVPVAESLLCAVYATEFAGVDGREEPHAALGHFAAHVLPKWPSLFRVRSTIAKPAALRLLFLFAVSDSPPRVELRDAILAATSLRDADRAFCAAVATVATPPPPTAVRDPFDHARKQVAAQDFDGAFQTLSALPPTSDHLRLLIHCATELQSLAATSAVLQAIAGASAETRASLLASQRDRVLLDHLAGAGVAAPRGAPEPAPASWIEWFERLNRSGSWPKALEVAELGVREWPADALLDDESLRSVRALLADQGRRSDQAQGMLRAALPFLLTSLLASPDRLPRAQELLIDILLILTDDVECGAADLAAIREVGGALIELGPPAGDYAQIVAFLTDVWRRFESPRTLDWLLEVLEVVALNPAPSPDIPRSILAQALASFSRWRGRATPEQWALLGVLSRELDAESAFNQVAPPATEVPDTRADFAGITIGIYTLMERSGQHAMEVLESTFPGVRAQINSDHVATDRLRDLARRADIFVMVTWAAKHAATACIEAVRLKNLPLLRPRSRSAAAIVNEVSAYLASR